MKNKTLGTLLFALSLLFLSLNIMLTKINQVADIREYNIYLSKYIDKYAVGCIVIVALLGLYLIMKKDKDD